MAKASPQNLFLYRVKYKSSHRQRKENPVATGKLNRTGIDAAPALEEGARRAHFKYVNAGFSDEYDVHTWMAAKAEIIAEKAQV